MKWFIPAKTFLIGEYIALQGGPALVLTTNPCFEVCLETGGSVTNLPINSPAYNWWTQSAAKNNYNLYCHDPYNGIGGLGASSAQFLGAYYAKNYIDNTVVDRAQLLENYLQVAWNGEGVAPSGYDVIAQMLGGCAYINKNANIYQTHNWPFLDIAFILLHTGNKQATHLYLQKLIYKYDTEELTGISNIACNAFIKNDAENFVAAINDYYINLRDLGLVAEHTITMINEILKMQDILAVKGCGALGSDILLVIVETSQLNAKIMELRKCNYIVASSNLGGI